MGEACVALGTPVTGGNVSFYNENPARRGASDAGGRDGRPHRFARAHHALRLHHEGDDIVLLGEPTDELGGSEYLARIHDVVAGAPPRCDLARERATIDALLEAIRGGVVRSAHDCSEGGFAIALAECCMADADANGGRGSRAHHVELASDCARCSSARHRRRIIVSTRGAATRGRDRSQARSSGTTSSAPCVHQRADSRFASASESIRSPLDRLAHAYHDAIPDIMNASIAEVAVLEQHPQPSGA